MSNPDDLLSPGYVPPVGWHEWAERRRAVMRGPQFGLEAMVRAFRHQGALIIRRVSQERSVAAWRPDNPLLQTVLVRAGRPTHRLGVGVTIPVGRNLIAVRGDVTTIRTQRTFHLVVEATEAALWIEDGDPWAEHAARH